ncbi:hypothetical protein GOV04_02185 [Candidatus Woesearchaeota archaeon]|nr:hypothetical protein [Candidatus Woesearchaeota archaeon]
MERVIVSLILIVIGGLLVYKNFDYMRAPFLVFDGHAGPIDLFYSFLFYAGFTMLFGGAAIGAVAMFHAIPK